MQPELKSAREIAEVVASRLRIPGAYVSVHSSDALGWTATVETRPGATMFAQQLVEEIARELRPLYSLKPD